MQSLRGAGVLGVLMAAVLVAAPAALASTEAGDDCVANTQEGIYTLVPLQRVSPSALSLTAPLSGVVTSWKVNSGVSEGVPEQMRVLQPTGAPNQFLTVGESTEQTVVQGTNVFPTRISVQAGDHFGVFGTVQDVVFCGGADPGDTAGFFLISAAVGSAHTFTPTTNVRIAMIAVIEPDKDGDGYGDETQDKCPQSAAYQGECPRVELGVVPIVGKKAVTLLVTTSITATVSVNASVAHHRSMRLGSSPYRNYRTPFETITPGQIAPLRLYFYRSLKSALETRSPKKHLTLNVILSAPNLTGPPTTQSLTLHLKGQAKPRQAG